MFGLGINELILIALVFGLLFFGASRMTNFARSLGRMKGEFKKGKQDMERELNDGEAEGAAEKKEN